MTKLDELVTQINREHVYIQTHNFPDPDAIASAFGLQELLKRSSASTIIRFMRKRSTGLRISGRVSGLAHRS